MSSAPLDTPRYHPAIVAGMKRHGIKLTDGRVPYGFTPAYYKNKAATAKIVSNRGAYRSGKSRAIIQLLLRRAAANPGRKTFFMRKYFNWLRLSTYADVIDQLKQWGWYREENENKTAHEYNLNGSRLIFLAFDDSRKLGSTECNDAMMEEGNEYCMADCMAVLGRMSAAPQGGLRNQLFIPFNPIDAACYLNSELLAYDDVQEIVTTLFDNPFLDEDYKKTLIDFYKNDENLYGVYVMGQWGRTEGRILKHFDIIDSFPADEWFTTLCHGTDWGTAAPTATIRCGWNRERPDELFVDEILYERGLSNAQIKARWEAQNLDQGTHMQADNNEPKTIDEFYGWGWNIHPAEKGPDSVRWGMNFLSRFTVHFSKRSMNAYQEAQRWMRMKDKDGNFIDKEMAVFNHCMAALRYCAEYLRGFMSSIDGAAPSVGGRLRMAI